MAFLSLVLIKMRFIEPVVVFSVKLLIRLISHKPYSFDENKSHEKNLSISAILQMWKKTKKQTVYIFRIGKLLIYLLCAQSQRNWLFDEARIKSDQFLIKYNKPYTCKDKKNIAQCLRAQKKCVWVNSVNNGQREGENEASRRTSARRVWFPFALLKTRVHKALKDRAKRKKANGRNRSQEGTTHKRIGVCVVRVFWSFNRFNRHPFLCTFSYLGYITKWIKPTNELRKTTTYNNKIETK